MDRSTIMPSKLNNGYSNRLDFCTNWRHCVPRHAFHQTQQLQCLYYGSNKFFLHRWPFAVYTLWLQCETLVSAELAGVLITLFLSPELFKVLEAKWIIIIHCDEVECAHPLLVDNWDTYSDDRTFLIFCECWIDCTDVFHAFLHL